MARPQKSGLEYFPLDVDIDNDEKVAYVISRYGFQAFGLLIKILMNIYRDGYYMMWTERQQYLFSYKLNVDNEYAKTVVSAYINEGFFNKNIYEKYGVLTSHGIQNRYLQAVGRRAKVKIAKEYCLLDSSEISKNSNINIYSINVNNNEVIADINHTETTENHAKSTQSKVKESIYISSSTSKKQLDLSDPDLGEVITAYSDNIHPITPIEAEQLADLMNDCSKEFMLEAIKRAVVRGKRSLGYIKSILDDWQVNGMDDGKPKTTRFNKSQPKKSTLSPAMQGLKEIMEGEDSA